MALYALGDLHLGFQVKKLMNQFGKVWKNHVRKIEKYVARGHCETGGHAGAHRGSFLGKEAAGNAQEKIWLLSKVFRGERLLLRGNHDMFWDVKKTEHLNEVFAGRLFFLAD